MNIMYTIFHFLPFFHWELIVKRIYSWNQYSYSDSDLENHAIVLMLKDFKSVQLYAFIIQTEVILHCSGG